MSRRLARTLGELKAAGYRSRRVKDELRQNLIARLRAGERLFPGLVGYERTVVPAIQDALLSRHDFILLGLRGQAKTRILRALPALLDEAIPVLEGSELNDDPLAPLSAWGRRRIAEAGDDAPVAWLQREQRYHEKLATPDVTIADLIGDIDPIKAATQRLAFSDEGVIHYGIIPRSNRGLFAINELPDLQARIQVGLLNLLEEGDIQIRGFPLRLPLDIALVFSANPEDYTHRGNIITPLRDRIASQILTHYPRSLEDGMAITAQEAWTERDSGVAVVVAPWLAELVEQVAVMARSSEFIDQNSGVSARMGIALMENLVSSAERRGVAAGQSVVAARVSDVYAATAAITGKVELVYEGEREGVAAVAKHLLGRAVKAVFAARLPDAYGPAGPPQARARPAGGRSGGGAEQGASGGQGAGGGKGKARSGAGGGGGAGSGGAPPEDAAGPPTEYTPILGYFRAGHTADVSETLTGAALVERLRPVEGLEAVVRRHLLDGMLAAAPGLEQAEALAAGMEFVLEGLHQNSLLSRQELVQGRVYRDPFDEMVRNLEA